MTVHETPIADLLIIQPKIFSDERGYFFESFRMSILQERGIDVRFVQDNESMSNRGVLRGLHLQAPPKAQAKLLRVVQGSIYDVAVDLRKDSPTYGAFFGAELSGENKTMLFIPEGFGHGFCCLEDHTIVQYKCSDYYAPDLEIGVRWDDPAIGIDWPIDQPILSEKDTKHPALADFKSPF
jgi:dTDP-4-dehydrorhamnose 3,5-epimerase